MPGMVAWRYAKTGYMRVKFSSTPKKLGWVGGAKLQWPVCLCVQVCVWLLKMAPERPKLPPGSPGLPQEAPRLCHEATRWHQEAERALEFTEVLEKSGNQSFPDFARSSQQLAKTPRQPKWAVCFLSDGLGPRGFLLHMGVV